MSEAISPQQRKAMDPSQFRWGVSTSSFQIEGATREDGRGDSIWDTFCRQKGRIANGDTGDVACDHYHRFNEDIALMRTMGVNAYRFSVAWPRVLPAGRGAANEAGLAFYDRLIDTLLGAGIEPWMCLYHWDLPQALDDLGGWQSRDVTGWFADYATLVGRRFGDRVKRFATFNEPAVFTLLGYAYSVGAPGLRDKAALHSAIHHVNLAHGSAVDALRAGVPGASIGAVHNRQPCLPASAAAADEVAAQRFADYWNGAFPEPQHFGCYPHSLANEMERYQRPGDMALICRPVDWFGVNHYSPNYIRANSDDVLGFGFGSPPDDVPRTAMGWPIVPSAFRESLLDIHRRYRLPIYVLENGTASNDCIGADASVEDPTRIAYLKSYIDAMEQAIKDGADVRGYFVWSLLDNFEWGSGYTQRFGLIFVDYATQRRIPKASFHWYADLIASSRVGLMSPSSRGERSV